MKRYIKLLLIAFFTLGFFTVMTNEADAAWQYRAGSAVSGSGAGNLSINKPTGTVQGDLIVVLHNAALSTSTPAPVDSGWTQISTGGIVTACCQLYAYYRIAGGSEPASYAFSFTNNGTSPQGIAIATFYNDNGASATLDVAAATDFETQVTAHSAPSITTTVNDTLLVGLFGADGTSGVNRSYTTSALTERVDQATNAGIGTMIASSVQASAGASGSKAVTLAGADRGRGYLAAFKISTSVTTTGNGGSSYNNFWASGTVNNQSGNTLWYGTKWGAGSGYSGTTCQNLPNTTLYSTVGNGYNGGVNANVSGASASTLYYFCIIGYDGSSIYYYSPTTSSLTTPAVPAPAVLVYGNTLVDNNSATIHAGIQGYGVSSNAVFRWGTSNVACASLPNTSGNISAGNNSGNYYPVQYRITSLNANTPYYYCVQGVSAQGTISSSVSSFTTAATAGSSCTMFPGSSLTDGTDEALIDTYLGTSKMKGTLRFKMTTNGTTTSAFHTASDAYDGTITLYRSTATNTVFGGFNPLAWSGSGYLGAGASFLFNLSSDYKLAQGTVADNAMYRTSAYGPTFGGGHNIGMPNSSLTAGPSTHYTQNSSAYYATPASQGAPSTYLHGGNTNQYFTPNEIEVYSVSVCDIIGPTVTTNAASSVTQTQATLNGNANPNGVATTGWFRYFTSNPGTCADSGGTRAPSSSGGSLGSGSTGVNYGQAISGLTPGTDYWACAIASSAQGTGVGSPVQFTTAVGTPTSVTTSTGESGLGSYYVTLNGSANPNNFASFGFFRLYTSDPGSCTDSGGTRYPSAQGSDTSLGSTGSPQTFAHTVGSGLTPGTDYWYCAFARNTHGAVGSSVDSFTTPDGATGPCDPPSSGDHTISTSCFYQSSVGGVDAGTGTNNTARLTVSSGTTLTMNTGQQVAWGNVGLSGTISFASGGSLRRGPIWVIDFDGDGVIAASVQYIGSQPQGGIRRNAVSTTYSYFSKIANSATTDCDDNNAYAYRVVSNLVTDADHDGYKTATGADTHCVGASTVINGRTYYNDGSGPN